MQHFLGKAMISYTTRKPINVVVLLLWCLIIASSCMNIYGSVISLGYNNEVVNMPRKTLLVFGDSIVDPGNNNYIDTVGKADFPPYGRDFDGHVATGRYSNGKIPSDLIAEALGIKELIPPYLNSSLQLGELLTGVSFASGAAGYDPDSAKLANTLSLDDQLKMFKEYINKLKIEVGDNMTSAIISQSIYLLCAGSNDITNTYFALPFRRLQYNVSSYTSLMVNWASAFVQELYDLGARRIGVISAPPCGCLPSQRTLHGGLLRLCAQKENNASLIYNDKLRVGLNSLNQNLKGSQIVYLDIYNPLLDLMNYPYHFGFQVANRGCCGTGDLEVSFLCTKFDLGTCKDASKYVFWDSFHPTEAAYRFIVNDIIKDNPNFFF